MTRKIQGGNLMSSEVIHLVEGLIAVVLAILGGKWYFNNRKITQKESNVQIAIQDSDNNEVNVGDKDEFKKEN